MNFQLPFFLNFSQFLSISSQFLRIALNCLSISLFLCLERARRGEPRGAILTQSTRTTSCYGPFGCDLGVFAFPNLICPKRHPRRWSREGRLGAILMLFLEFISRFRFVVFLTCFHQTQFYLPQNAHHVVTWWGAFLGK